MKSPRVVADRIVGVEADVVHLPDLLAVARPAFGGDRLRLLGVEDSGEYAADAALELAAVRSRGGASSPGDCAPAPCTPTPAASADELVEAGMRALLLGEPLPPSVGIHDRHGNRSQRPSQAFPHVNEVAEDITRLVVTGGLVGGRAVRIARSASARASAGRAGWKRVD